MPNCTTSLCKQLIGILNSVKTFYFPEQKKTTWTQTFFCGNWYMVKTALHRTPLNDIVSSLGVTSLISSNFSIISHAWTVYWLRCGHSFSERLFLSLSAFQFSQWAQEPPHRPNKFHFILHSKNGNRLKIQFTICLNDWINSMRH